MPQRLKYSEDNLSLIKTSVENLLKTNAEYFYSIKVNGVTIVPKTNNVELFDSFLKHVNENTETVVFVSYYGDAKGGDTITLYVSGMGDVEENRNPNLDGYQRNASGLRGMNAQSELRRQIYAEVQNGFLTDENGKLKAELEKAQTFIKEVDVLIAQLRSQRSQVKDKGTLEYIGNFLSKMATVNPGLLKNSPALDALLGFLPTSEEKKTVEIPAEVLSGTVTAKPKGENTEQPAEVTRLVMVLQKLRRYFSEIEFEQCLEMLATIKDHKEMIQPTINFLNNHIEKKLQWLENQRQKIEKQNTSEPDGTENIENEKTEPKEDHEKTEIGKEKTTRVPTKGASEPYEEEPKGVDWQ